MIFGDKMPDKDDPKYRKRREKEMKAGRAAAKALRIDRLVVSVQRFAVNYPKTFLVLVFGFVVCCFCYNVRRVYLVYNDYQNRPDRETAVERQDKRLERHGLAMPGSRGKVRPASEDLRTLLEAEVNTLMHKKEDMTHSDSLRMKLLLEQLVELNKRKKEKEDGNNR